MKNIGIVKYMVTSHRVAAIVERRVLGIMVDDEPWVPLFMEVTSTIVLVEVVHVWELEDASAPHTTLHDLHRQELTNDMVNMDFSLWTITAMLMVIIEMRMAMGLSLMMKMIRIYEMLQ